MSAPRLFKIQVTIWCSSEPDPAEFGKLGLVQGIKNDAREAFLIDGERPEEVVGVGVMADWSEDPENDPAFAFADIEWARLPN